MDYYERIAGNFQQTMEAIAMSVDALAAPIDGASEIITEALLGDRKVLACGLGNDNALCQLLAGGMLHRHAQERPALPVMALSADATTTDYFAQPVKALGQAGDVLVCINTSADDTHPCLQAAMAAASERAMAVVYLSNVASATPAPATDIYLGGLAPRQSVELAAMTIHNLCDLIDCRLFGAYDLD